MHCGFGICNILESPLQHRFTFTASGKNPLSCFMQKIWSCSTLLGFRSFLASWDKSLWLHHLSTCMLEKQEHTDSTKFCWQLDVDLLPLILCCSGLCGWICKIFWFWIKCPSSFVLKFSVSFQMNFYSFWMLKNSLGEIFSSRHVFCCSNMTLYKIREFSLVALMYLIINIIFSTPILSCSIQNYFMCLSSLKCNIFQISAFSLLLYVWQRTMQSNYTTTWIIFSLETSFNK